MNLRSLIIILALGDSHYPSTAMAQSIEWIRAPALPLTKNSRIAAVRVIPDTNRSLWIIKPGSKDENFPFEFTLEIQNSELLITRALRRPPRDATFFSEPLSPRFIKLKNPMEFYFQLPEDLRPQFPFLELGPTPEAITAEKINSISVQIGIWTKKPKLTLDKAVLHQRILEIKHN